MIEGTLLEDRRGWHFYSKAKQLIIEIKLDSTIEVKIENKWYAAIVEETPRGLLLRSRGLRISEHLPARIEERKV